MDHLNGLSHVTTQRPRLSAPSTAVSSALGGGWGGAVRDGASRPCTPAGGEHKFWGQEIPAWHQRGHTHPGLLGLLFSEGPKAEQT